MNHLRTVLLLIVSLAGNVATAQQDLPDDRERYNLIIVTADQPSDAGQRLLSWLQTDETLDKISRSTVTHRFTVSNQIYRERYAAALPPASLPIVALTRADGGVIYKASGANLPGTPKELSDSLLYYGRLDKELRNGPAANSWDDCPDGNCPYVQPQPADPSRPWLRPLQPDGALRPDTWIPDTIQPQVNVNIDTSWIAWVAVAVLGVLVVFAGVAGLYLVLKD